MHDLYTTRPAAGGPLTTIESNPIDNESRALLPIRSVSQITGVNPITLRAWERRYDLIRPTRTPAGHRLYSQQDIRTIQRIQELAESGMGFAQIALLLDQEDQQPTAKPRPEPVPRQAPPRSLLDRVIRAGMELDPAGSPDPA
ncbi:MAG TPA: MerR family transcriptional regulator, partial [Halothiobacillaceae bacterium]|nr:MerR family transcriptional regulator [Halothiobacillaceae bacterium]